MYVLENREGELLRLEVQGAALAPETSALLDLVGVGPGWRCLDLACGAGDVTRLLAARVGVSGQVVGLDMARAALVHARTAAGTLGADAAAIGYIEGNAEAAPLPDASFDLVHGRFWLGATGAPDAQVAQALRLVRPGGTLALQEQDLSATACFPPHPAFARLKQWLGLGLEQSGSGRGIARRLFATLRAVGLEDVRFRPCAQGCRGTDPMGAWLPETVESLRRVLVTRGLADAGTIDAALADCRRHLAEPDTVVVNYMLFQVWGRRPPAG